MLFLPCDLTNIFASVQLIVNYTAVKYQVIKCHRVVIGDVKKETQKH